MTPRSNLLAGVRHLLVPALLIGASASASVLDLNFSDGNGNTSVDQYQGLAGDGWASSWLSGSGSGSTLNASVQDSSPLPSGGNYLSVSYAVTGTGQTANQYAYVSRQLDSSAIDLSAAVTYKFVVRADAPVNNSNQTLTFFSGTSATQNNGGSDTWRISTSGAGWLVYDGNSSVAVGMVGATSLQGTSYEFTVISDPLSQSYTVSILNLINSTVWTSDSLAWRSTAATENEFLNFTSKTPINTNGTFGFSIDSVSVVPEPGATAAAVALLVCGGLLLRRKLRR